MFASQRPLIHVVGLGPGSWTSMPLGTYQLLGRVKDIFLRTAWHPVVKELRGKGISFLSFDDIYEQGEDFPTVYETIVERLFQAAKEKKEIVYAVPGHPGIGETTVQQLVQRSGEQQVDVRIGTGHSFLDELFLRLQIDPAEGVALLDGTALHHKHLNPSLHTVITEIHSRDMASDVKLTLLQAYPDEYPVTLLRAVGVEGEERIERMPLYTIDRVDWVDHLTTLYLAPADDEAVTNRQFWRLLEIVEHLRSPEGCPWDREQTHRSIRKHVLEEAYEVADAIDRDDPDDLCEELGDLLLQVALHAQMAAEEGMFDAHDVIQAINEKLIRRHPHVFAQGEARDAKDVEANWEAIKKKEKEQKERMEEPSLLDSVPRSFPALLSAYKLQKKAASVGFDWREIEPVYAKIEEEWREFRKAKDTEERMEELGDLLFAIINLARFLKIDPEEALARTNEKFRQRFRYIERRIHEQGRTLEEADLEEMDRYWTEAKQYH
jgi:tetrapyrrole methylase family protein/MazG family protein